MIPQIGFNACYNDAVGSPNKCLAFAIIQSCAASQQVLLLTTQRSLEEPCSPCNRISSH